MTIRETRSDRQTRLAQMLIASGGATVDDLVESFDVSAMTLYRDLAELESRRVISRVRGEIRVLASSFAETPVSFRMTDEVAVKELIGKQIAQEIEKAGSVFIDDSTTSAMAVKHLVTSSTKTFITNSVTIANSLVETCEFRELVTVGGNLNPTLNASFGPLAEASIDQFSPDIAVLGAAAIHKDQVFHPIVEAASFKRKLIAHTPEVILAVSAMKFSRRAMYKMADIADVSAIVTDSRIDTTLLAHLRELTRVVVVAYPGKENNVRDD